MKIGKVNKFIKKNETKVHIPIFSGHHLMPKTPGSGGPGHEKNTCLE